MVSITLADLLITAIVLPASSVAILGEMEDSENICRLQYGVSSMSYLTSAIFSAVIGIENFLRLKSIRHADEARQRQAQEQPLLLSSSHPHPVFPHSSHHQSLSNFNNQHGQTTSTLLVQQHHHQNQQQGQRPRKHSICTVFQVTVLNLTVWLVSSVIVLIHFIFMPQIMYAICDKPKVSPYINYRLNEQLLFESLTVFGICSLSFVILGGFGFLKTIFIMRSWTKPKPFLTTREFALVSTNCWNWLVRILIWLPCLIAAIFCLFSQSQNRTLEFQHRLLLMTTMSTSSTSQTSFTNSSMAAEGFTTFQRLVIWPAILPSCLSSLVNVMANRDFRRCYAQLFHYCCCKTSVALTRRPRDQLRAASDVRVHIIPGYNIYSSSVSHSNEVSSSATPARFNIKCGPIKMHSNKRDVYEL